MPVCDDGSLALVVLDPPRMRDRGIEYHGQPLVVSRWSSKLKTTVQNFSAFVDELAKNPGKKKMEPSDYFFLGRCYDSLEQYQKAADMYKMVPEPAGLVSTQEVFDGAPSSPFVPTAVAS